MKKLKITQFMVWTKAVLFLCPLLFGAFPLWAQKFEWVRGWGGTAAVASKAIAVDKDKNVICVGHFNGTADLNPGSGTTSVTSSGQADIFVSKFDADGDFKWGFKIGNAYGDAVNDVTTDKDGNIYIIGSFFFAALDFDPGPATHSLTADNADIYIAKYDKDGNYVHAVRIGSSSGDQGMGIAVDEQGYIYHTGNFTGTVDFNPGTGTFNMTSAGSSAQDIYISKLDPAFNLVWAKKIGGTFTGEYGKTIKLDGKGHLYFTGSFAGSNVNFDPNGGTYLVSPNSAKGGNGDGYVSKFDTAGSHVWTKNIGGNNNNADVTHAVAIDAVGNVYVVGTARDTVYFGPRATATFSNISTGGTDGYVAKLDPAGNFLWANHIAGTGNDDVVAVQVDVVGNVYITGYFENSVDLDPDPVGTKMVTGVSNSRDIFICKYDTDGKYLWGDAMGNADVDAANDLELDETSTMYITGIFRTVVDFNPGTDKEELTAAANGSIFALKLQPDCAVYREFNEVVCDSFTFNGKTHRETGIYKDTFAGRIPSCDSITILNLVVNKSANNPVISGHYCDSISFNGVTYKTTGHFAQHYQTVHGCDSTIQYDLIIGNSNAQALTINACDSFSLNDTLVYKSSGIHVVTFTNASGCDSTVILNLTINTSPEASFTQNGNVLKATEGDEWQWIDCATGEAIDGATDQEYEVQANGRYAVVVGVDGVCADTSSCQEVVLEENKIVGIDQAEFVHLYPNPASVTITLSSGEDLQGSEIRIVSMAGQVLDVVRPGKGHAVVLHIGDLARGIYFAEILPEDRNMKRVKFVKE